MPDTASSFLARNFVGLLFSEGDVVEKIKSSGLYNEWFKENIGGFSNDAE